MHIATDIWMGEDALEFKAYAYAFDDPSEREAAADDQHLSPVEI